MTKPKPKKVKVIATTFFPPPPPPTCAYEVPGEGRCLSHPEKHGYCHQHIRESPRERATVELLLNKVRDTKSAMDDLASRILLYYVVHGDAPIPEDLKREYRALWYRHNYLATVRNSRRVGDELPAEVTMLMPRSA